MNQSFLVLFLFSLDFIGQGQKLEVQHRVWDPLEDSCGEAEGGCENEGDKNR